MPAAPTPVDASVATQLTGLLASDSPYLALARNAGMRTAGRRGLVNSSIAAGSAEAAAIAAAAPIASQDASQLHATNQTNLEGWTSLRNATALEQMQENARVWAQQDQNIQQILLNNSTNSSAMERLLKQGDIESAIALMREDKALTQTQINANVSLLGNYMNAFAELSKNENIPSDVRDAYLREFQRVTGSGQSLVNALSGMTPRGGTGGTGGTGGSISTGNGTSFNPSSTPFTTAPKNPWTGPTPSQILAMYNDGKKGGYGYASAEEAGAAYNAWASANGVKQLDLPAAAPKKKSGLLGALISPLGKAIGLI